MKWEAVDDMYPRFGPLFVNSEHYLLMGWGRESGYCLRTRSAATGELVSEVTSIPSAPNRAVLSPDATHVAGVWSTFLYSQPVSGPFSDNHVARNDNKKHFADLAYHPSGRYIATASNDETVKFYDTTTWELIRTFTWKTGKMRAVVFSPDGNLVAAGGEKGQVVVWDVDL
jgi:WD40 repeat protein